MRKAASMAILLVVVLLSAYAYAEDTPVYTDADLGNYQHEGNSVHNRGNTSGYGQYREPQRQQSQSSREENPTGSIYTTCKDQCGHDQDICRTRNSIPGREEALHECSIEYRECAALCHM